MIFGVQVAISFAKILLKSIRPGIEELGRLPGTDIFCDISQYPMAIKTPAIITIRVNSSLLCFANANFIRERYSNFCIYLCTMRKKTEKWCKLNLIHVWYLFQDSKVGDTT